MAPRPSIERSEAASRSQGLQPPARPQCGGPPGGRRARAAALGLVACLLAGSCGDTTGTPIVGGDPNGSVGGGAPLDGAATDASGGTPIDDAGADAFDAGGFGGSSSFDGGPLRTCPTQPPPSDAECFGFANGLFCPYSEAWCHCLFGSWRCDPIRAACPDTPPQNRSDCLGLEGLDCHYATAVCNCEPDGNWNCFGNDFGCPETKPLDDSSCDGLQGADCLYADGLCECEFSSGKQRWLCW